MKAFLIIAGLLIILGSFFFLENDLKKIVTYKTGSIIKAKVVYVPMCTSGKRHYYFKFEYNGGIYAKDIGGKLCEELIIGEMINLKTNKTSTIFLYEKENPYIDMISGFVFFIFGLLLMIMGIKKQKPIIKNKIASA